MLDANVLINAERDYYPIDRVPEFWSWLAARGSQGVVRTPKEIYDEVVDGQGALTEWLKSHKADLLLAEDPAPELIARVVDVGYAEDLDDAEILRLGRDPFLVAAALVDREKRVVVTAEVSKPGKQRANRQLPDVCESLDVEWVDPFRFLRLLDFRTNWS